MKTVFACFSFRIACLVMLAFCPAASAAVVAWGDNSNNQTAVSDDASNAVVIAAGGGHNVAIKPDGTVAVWGYNPYGQLDVPPGLANVVGVTAAYDHSLALLSDGTVVAWGRNQYGQTDVPPGLNNVVAVSANQFYNLALRSDGTVVHWGNNDFGQGNVPPGLANVAAISAGSFHVLALLNDGTVVAWGYNASGQTNVPPGLDNVVAIAAGGGHSLALRSDGTVVAWGYNGFGQAIVPPDVTNIVAISTGFDHNLVLKADGTVVAWGWDTFGQATVPLGLAGVDAIAAGFQHSLALLTDNPPDNQPPTISCPRDLILPCANCNTDPAITGMATAVDEGPVTLSYTDSVSGECPKVITRTWVATDRGNKTASCVQTLTCMPSSFVSLVTDSSGCTFDLDRATLVPDFRLIFTHDPQNFPCYRLAASNPGQFYYNVFYTGVPGQEASFDITLPYPFVTQGANPVHAYDWVTVQPSNGQQCLLSGNAIFVSSQQVALSDYETPAQPSTTVTVTLKVPDSGAIFLAIHLNYGLKKVGGFTKNASDDAVDCATGATVLIPNHGSYPFSVSGALSDTATIQNINVFKRNPGIAGLARSKTTEASQAGARVTLTNARRTLLMTATTDADGFYQLIYKHSGKEAVYYVSIITPSGYRETKTITLKSNKFVQVDFWTP